MSTTVFMIKTTRTKSTHFTRKKLKLHYVKNFSRYFKKPLMMWCWIFPLPFAKLETRGNVLQNLKALAVFFSTSI